MDGVRILSVETQFTEEHLRDYFENPKYGGGAISDIYYPLRNNDAVILFSTGPKSGSKVSTELLARKHDKFTVVALPHKVFSKVQVWVDSEMSALIQAIDAYCQKLKDIGGVSIGMDSNACELILTGTDYQLEWAQMYLSQLKDNQIHIANTLRRNREVTAAIDHERRQTATSSSRSMVNGDGAARSASDPVASPRRHMSHASKEVNGHTSSSVRSRTPTEVRSYSPASAESKRPGERVRSNSLMTQTAEAAAETPTPKPRGSARNEDTRSTGFSPSANSLADEEGEVGRITAGMEKMTAQYDSLNNSLEKRHRQADADATFNKFASIPNGPDVRRREGTDLTKNLDQPPSRNSSHSWQTMPGRSDMERAERAHRDEHHSSLDAIHSLDYQGASAGGLNHQSPAPFSSLQPLYGHDDYDEGAGAIGVDRSFPSAAFRRSLSHGASTRTSEISPYALMSNASIELSRRSFKITHKLILKIFVDDITKAHTEAVVNAANWELKNIGGVAGALARAAGREMTVECDQLFNKHGFLKTGQVVKTKAYGKLSHMKYVIHTVGPIFMSSTHKDEEQCVYELAQTFFNCLEFADSLALKTLTFPFISTGIFGVPMDQCVMAIVTALLAYSEKKSPCLEEVHFVNNDINVACEAILLTDQRLKIETVVSALQRLEEGAQRYGHHVYPHCRKNSVSRSGSKYPDDEKSYSTSMYAGFTSHDVAASRDSSRHSRLVTHYHEDDAKLQSLPPFSTHTSDSRSGSSDRSRPKTHDDNTLSSQRKGREPSPRPSTTGGRPRSSSLDMKDRPKVLKELKELTKKQETLSSKGKAPTFKPALGSTPAGKKSSTAKSSTAVANRSSSSKGGAPVKVPRPGKSSDHSGVSDTDTGSVAGSEDDDGTCPICLEPFRHPKKLPCGHTFCTQCVDRALTTKPKCPKCQRNFGMQTGTQPKDGRMTYRVDHSIKLEGYGLGAFVISYYIPGGIQEAYHPNPGQYYNSIDRTAYLPYNNEGKEVLKMLEKAFAQRLIFTIGESHTTGATGVITWNDIHHKTSATGGPTNYGYPDPHYLRRVKEELADKGITSP